MKSKKKFSLFIFSFVVSIMGVGAVQAASTFHFKGGCSRTCSGDWGIGSSGGIECNGIVTGSSGCKSIAPPTRDNSTARKSTVKKTRKQSFKKNGDVMKLKFVTKS